MKLSIYTSAFNVNKMGFDWMGALTNFMTIADEVVVMVNTSEDDSYQSMLRFSQEFRGLFIYQSDFDYGDPEFDGKIKNEALKMTTGDIKVSLDLDERIPVYQREMWRGLAENLLETKHVAAVMIPSINLCGDIYHYKDIGYKWYMHKGGLKRGVVKFARQENGKIDITKSDTCELVTEDGDLVPSYYFPQDINALRSDKIPYVFHYWGVSLEQRLRQNAFWKPVWENRAGREVDDVMTESHQIDGLTVYPHNLEI